MAPSDTPERTPNFITYGRARFERTVLNLPRLLALENFAETNGFEDAQAGTHLLSRLIIALNGVATWLSYASQDDDTPLGRTAAELADILWTFGDDCAAVMPRLEMLDDARRA